MSGSKNIFELSHTQEEYRNVSMYAPVITKILLKIYKTHSLKIFNKIKDITTQYVWKLLIISLENYEYHFSGFFACTIRVASLASSFIQKFRSHTRT